MFLSQCIFRTECPSSLTVIFLLSAQMIAVSSGLLMLIFGDVYSNARRVQAVVAGTKAPMSFLPSVQHYGVFLMCCGC